VAKHPGIYDARQVSWGSALDGTSETEGVPPSQIETKAAESRSRLEQQFDPTFAIRLALREKQIQQNYRPIIGIHKWFARRPGTVFRSLLLAEYNGSEPLETSYWREHKLNGVIADPFMGGGTPIYEANRLGFSVLGTDTNPMAFWVVRQALGHLDTQEFASAAEEVAVAIEDIVGEFYKTTCLKCGLPAQVKYFIWVKTEQCPTCQTVNDLFPGYVLAGNSRHPRHVVACSECGCLNECDEEPSKDTPIPCAECGGPVYTEGPARRQQVECRQCGTEYPYPARESGHPLPHRMWAIEYHCEGCKPTHKGRFFKRPDADDIKRYNAARLRLHESPGLPIPDDEIPRGDETDRLLRWGYRRYREMFTERQLLGLGLLLRRITQVSNSPVRHALLTVFSDFLRYQNMLCRYDTYALKCQDIFSVHGFPVGLVQCENNLLGIPKVGAGAFRHFVEKYLRAKRYCEAPFETRLNGKRKEVVPIRGERIMAEVVGHFPVEDERQAQIAASPADAMPLAPGSLDGVFTDPPYFANVQYAELMDFNYVWLRQALRDEFTEFAAPTTRSSDELTGNVTMGRGIEHFTEGLSAVFRHYATALKPGAPFVFTYHHNDPASYVAVVVAVLDAGLDCTATLPAAAEMNASLHILGTNSAVLDSVFVCRRIKVTRQARADIHEMLTQESTLVANAGVRVSPGDIRCLASGHIARVAINGLRDGWDKAASLSVRMKRAEERLVELAENLGLDSLPDHVLANLAQQQGPTRGVRRATTV
jgi:adenine-specific DNA methylase